MKNKDLSSKVLESYIAIVKDLAQISKDEHFIEKCPEYGLQAIETRKKYLTEINEKF